MAFDWTLPTTSPDHYRTVIKFGRNPSVGTTFAPIAIGGIYQTPQVSGATTLRVKAGNAADDVAGAGARKVTLQGLDAAGNEVTEEIATAGVSPGGATTNTFLRLYRAWVSESGTYGTTTTGSHVGDITIENSAGSADWLTINSTDYPRGQSEICAYTVPKGYQAYIFTLHIGVESNKTADIVSFRRDNILETAPPYSAVRMAREFPAVDSEVVLAVQTPSGPFEPLTDIVFLAKAATSASVVADFEILLVNEKTQIPGTYDRV